MKRFYAWLYALVGTVGTKVVSALNRAGAGVPHWTENADTYDLMEMAEDGDCKYQAMKAVRAFVKRKDCRHDHLVEVAIYAQFRSVAMVACRVLVNRKDCTADDFQNVIINTPYWSVAIAAYRAFDKIYTARRYSNAVVRLWLDGMLRVRKGRGSRGRIERW